MQAVVDTTVDGLIIIDRAGIVQLFNRACERLFGWRADEVIGRNVRMLMPTPYRDAHDDYLHRYHHTGERRIIGIGREVTGLRKDGSTFPMELSVGEAPEGETPFYVGVIRDVTERKQAEALLREREARLRSILETMTDGVVLIDDRGLIQLFGGTAERMFGWRPDEVIGRNVSLLMPAPYRERHDGYLDHYRATGEKRIIGIGRVVVAQRKDGSTFPVELSVGEMLVDGSRSFIGFVRDITERQGAERRVQELQAELLHSSRVSTMGQMASALAHELNQPLTAVINYSQAARRLIDNDAARERVLPVLEKSVAQASRAGQIIRRLRDFLEKGETERRLEDVGKVIEEATALALVGAKDSGVRVTLTIDHALPGAFMDKIQIQQVILNLVRNALEAMESSPMKALTVRNGRNLAGDIETAVIDTGPGLAPDIEAQLFQPFVSTKRTGMGLGLSICRTIIEAHGGRLWATRDPAGGTAFRFTLPPGDRIDDG